MSAEQNASGEGAGQFPKFLWMEAVIAACRAGKAAVVPGGGGTYGKIR